MSVTPAARNGLRFEVWVYLKERWRIWRMFSALSIFVGTGIISYIWWNNNGSISVQDKVLQTFEEGGIPHWNSVFEDDAFATIKRPEKKLEEFSFIVLERHLIFSSWVNMAQESPLPYAILFVTLKESMVPSM
jgi:hypothetical protein